MTLKTKTCLSTKESAPQVFVGQLGARMHYAVPVLLHRARLLAHLFTDTYAGKGSGLYSVFQYLPSTVRQRTAKRLAQRVAEIPAEKVTALNFWGLSHWFILRYGSSHLIHRWVVTFGQRAASSPHLGRATTVYGFKNGSLELLSAGRNRGLLTILEQMSAPSAEYYDTLEIETNVWRGWQSKDNSPWKDQIWFTRQASEWDLADVLVAPSPYVKSTLIASGVPEDKVATIPYAVSLTTYPGRVHYYDGSRTLRVLFVGSVNLNKGVPYLLQALREMGSKKVEARLVGGVALKSEELAEYQDVAQTTGRVSRAEVTAYYDWADVFVLPSLCEGSATATYEARACGLPVVVTPNTGAWVKNGEDGLIVPTRDSNSLAEALRSFINQPALVERMSRAALRRAPHFSWEAYQQRLSALVLALHHGKSVWNITMTEYER